MVVSTKPVTVKLLAGDLGAAKLTWHLTEVPSEKVVFSRPPPTVILVGGSAALGSLRFLAYWNHTCRLSAGDVSMGLRQMKRWRSNTSIGFVGLLKRYHSLSQTFISKLSVPASTLRCIVSSEKSSFLPFFNPAPKKSASPKARGGGRGTGECARMRARNVVANATPDRGGGSGP